MSSGCPKSAEREREREREQRVNLTSRVFWLLSPRCSALRVCGMLSGLVGATVGAATFTLVRLPGGLRVVGGGGQGGGGGADVFCCQPTRSPQSCSRAEVEVMMLHPHHPTPPSFTLPATISPPPLPPTSGGGDYYDVDVVDPLSQLFFSFCVWSAKSGKGCCPPPSSILPPTHMHTPFFFFFFKAALICVIQTKPPLAK